jgi:NAD(P)-dependent dehydrogenase (short-subunit alcohol dehydrogenase family)
MDQRRLWLGAAAGGAAIGYAIARRLREQDLHGRVALVTGASRGLGFRIADRLAAAGCPLAICARERQQLAEARDRLARHGLPVYARSVDVSDPTAAAAFVAEVEAELGRIDILVNNAGIIQVGPLEDMTLADFRHCVDIDFWGVVHTTLAALPGMRRRRAGTIVNITSIGGEISVPHLLPYSCAKAAARAFSEGLTAELAHTGVRVVTVVPWLMRTGSVPYIFFKGRHDQELALFRQGQRHVVSLSADRAARRIVRALRRGEARLTLGLFAKLAREAHAGAPGLLSRFLGQAARLMPSPTEGPSPAVRGQTLQIGP